MVNGIYVAVSGAEALEQAVDVTAHNVANASTVGYRAERLSFHQAMSRARGKDAGFVQVGQTTPDVKPGEVHATGNPLDVALVGDGYLAVNSPQGVRYTRSGNLTLDPNGTLTTQSGLAVRAVGGRTIMVPPGSSDFQIRSDGTITANEKVLGQLELTCFAPESLVAEGATLFRATAAPLAAAPPKIVPGSVEASNFNVVDGMVDLIRTSRTYEALHRMIETYRDMDSSMARDGGNA